MTLQPDIRNVSKHAVKNRRKIPVGGKLKNYLHNKNDVTSSGLKISGNIMASSSNEQTLEQQEWILAKQGLKLLINNKGKEAEVLFLKYPDSLVMYSGYSFAVFMDALMSFEEDKLTKAIMTLKEVERRCNNRGWFKYMKSKMFGSSEDEPSLTETLETQIILADSQVCLAILVFLQQDISGYLKAGWVLRKAWKVYQSTYSDILNLYNSEVGPLNLPDPTLSCSSSENVINVEKEILSALTDDERRDSKGYFLSNPFPNSQSFQFENTSKISTMKKSHSIHGTLARPNVWKTSLSFNYFTSTFGFFSSTEKSKIDRKSNKKIVIRLMNAVTFGYGLFQLGVSLLPPTLLRLTSFLGLSGNRMHGLACLMYSRLGVDMRAPLATLSLLWYHCIVRPFYALDGTNLGAANLIANQLIRETQEEFAESALFLFFKGRLCRLNSDIPSALIAFQASVKFSTQREIKLLSLHEVGWCYLIQLDFQNAESNFSYLSSWSRWSKSFYCYITCICRGSRGGFSEFSALEELIDSVKTSTKGNQMDEFLTKRIALAPTLENFHKTTKIFWKLFVYEMLYLWNALASCTKENLTLIISDCNLCQDIDEPMCGISKLIKGACLLILGENLEARVTLQKCIESRVELTPKSHRKDEHILAFARYELGCSLYNNPETKDEGRKVLQQVVHIKDYDFEDRLSVRVSSMLRI